MKRTEIKLVNGDNAVIVDNNEFKILKSENYNFLFNKKDGFFCRWGKTQEDDGDSSLSWPEIIDMEISTTCHGVGTPCKFCYKSNTSKGEYMTFETFKKVFAKLPPTITQLAAGIGDIDSNPDMWKIFEYCRENDVIPNVTINGARMTSEYFDNLAKYCGAVACSVYDKDLTYNSIKELTNRGMRQINIHYMISEQSVFGAYDVINDMQNDTRLSNMNAIVFLSLKQKGNAKTGYTQLSQEKFNDLCKYALSKNIKFGFDSCSSRKFFNYLDSDDTLTKEFKEQMYQCIEPCESSVFSSYVSCGSSDKGPQYYPCSFCEGIEGWEEGIDILSSDDFIKDVWYNGKTQNFKNKLLSCNRDCPIYKI
jgi:MoaA/NifB/PqqE/SkfB family radical SAM enzyme